MGLLEDEFLPKKIKRSKWLRIKTAITLQIPAAKYRICCWFVRVLAAIAAALKLLLWCPFEGGLDPEDGIPQEDMAFWRYLPTLTG